jgi:hypothetical protein
MTLLLIGVGLTVIGGLVALANRTNWRRRQRILTTPTCPVAHAPGNGLVEVKGRILPSEQGLVQTPFSGRHAVWCRVKVEERRSSGKNSYWHTLLTEADGRVFLVDDGSGQVARVEPTGATVMLDARNVASSGTFNDAAPHLEAFLASRGLKSTSWLGFNKSMRYSEEILSPGDPLFAIGPSRRDPGPPVSDGYRMVPSSQLVMVPGFGEQGELILTNKSEEQLVGSLGWGFVIGLVMAGVGVLLGFAGAVVQLASVV